MRWVGHVAHIGERRGAYRILMGNLRARDHLEGPGIDGNKQYSYESSRSEMGGHGLD
jgi:hypothetical protein